MVIIALLVAWLAPLVWLFAAAERAIATAHVRPHDELTEGNPSAATQVEPIASIELTRSEPADLAAGVQLDQAEAVSDALFEWATPRMSRKQDRLRQVA